MADIEAIRKDLSETIKPSWVGSLPKDLGSKGHGKLKADQWRAIATIFLPNTLIQRWNSADYGAGENSKLEMLDNTMDLVNAIILATKRVITEQDCQGYMELMLRYLENLKRLYPHLQLRPVHHAALHLGEFLRMYGPVYGWWTFPFERLIGVLQKVDTNDKQGDNAIQSSSLGSSVVRGNGGYDAFDFHRVVKLAKHFDQPSTPSRTAALLIYVPRSFAPQNS